LGKDGKPQEKIYDVVWGDKDRRKIVGGKLTPVGNTVDVASATFANTIGDPELVAVWKDPDFDPSVRRVYYARVLEIPTPRWTAYDAAYFKIKITDPKVPMTTQERAFTSPIWYSPKERAPSPHRGCGDSGKPYAHSKTSRGADAAFSGDRHRALHRLSMDGA